MAISATYVKVQKIVNQALPYSANIISAAEDVIGAVLLWHVWDKYPDCWIPFSTIELVLELEPDSLKKLQREEIGRLFELAGWKVDLAAGEFKFSLKPD